MKRTAKELIERDLDRAHDEAVAARANFIHDMEWLIRDLQREVDNAKRGDTIYASSLRGSLVDTIQQHATESRLLTDKANRLRFILDELSEADA